MTPDDGTEFEGRAEDPFVRGRAPDPTNPSQRGVSLSGLWGESDRPGRGRLYLTTRLDYFVEVRLEQVVAVESVPAEEPPFVGLDATRVTLAPDASVEWVRRVTGGADQFALEARDAIVQPPDLRTWGARCPVVTHPFGESDFDPCNGNGTGGGTGGGTFGPWPSQGGHTCATCQEATCATCNQGTCDTCGGGTCVTCDGACPSFGGTCDTCATCGRDTCVGCTQWTACGTCDTCASCVATCEGTCASCNNTCGFACVPTRADTCDTCVTCGGTCQATCETCHTCDFFTCGTCPTDPGWCFKKA